MCRIPNCQHPGSDEEAIYCAYERAQWAERMARAIVRQSARWTHGRDPEQAARDAEEHAAERKRLAAVLVADYGYPPLYVF